MNFRRIRAIFSARNKEFVRDRAALSWNIIFPLLLVVGFAFIFSGEPADEFRLGIITSKTTGTDDPLAGIRYIKRIPVTDRLVGTRKVERHQLDMLIDLATKQYWINDSAPKSYILEKLLQAANRPTYTRHTLSGHAIRYVDWVLPGILAMNMMFSAFWGIGYVIVRYRRNGVLKRLHATPVNALEFLVAQIASRLWVMLAVTSFIFIATGLSIDFVMIGSYIDLVAVFLAGAMSLITVGLLVASRTSAQELADGLLNMISWPMMLLGGVWFSLEGLHPWVQQLSALLPLTHLVSAMRAIMLEGATLAQLLPQLSALIGTSIVLLAIGVLIFRWE